MYKSRRLNCYVFCNLIVSLLTLNVLTNPTSKVLVEKSSSNTLSKIYEKENIVEEVIEIPEVEEQNVEEQISNDTPTETKTFNYVKPTYNSLTGSNLVNYAMQFLGLPYVSAGNSLATGTDCSGFTRLIYQEFGISLGRTVSSQINSGTYVSKEDLQPGDLVFYSYGNVATHVAIYIGNGTIIHESTPKNGVKLNSVNIMNYITARRLITANVVSAPQEEVKQEVVEPSVVEVEQNTNEVVDNSNNNVEVNQTTEVVKQEEPVKEEDKEKEETKENKNVGKRESKPKENENIESSNE